MSASSSMGGAQALRGFEYQELALLYIWLKEQCANFARRGGAANPIVSIGIEVAPQDGTGATWDTYIRRKHGPIHVLEAKSGQIKKEHRVSLWRRIRETLATEADTRFGVILDPDFASSQIGYFGGLADEPLGDIQPPRDAPPAAVTTATDLAKEALFWLCSAEDTTVPAVEPDEARRALRSLRIFPFRRSQLRALLADALRLLCPHALAGDGLAVLKDHLRQAAISARSQPVECDRLLAHLQSAFGLDPATRDAKKLLNELIELSQAVMRRARERPVGISWGPGTGTYLREIGDLPGRGSPDVRTPWAAGPLVAVLGNPGIGKTVFMQLAFAQVGAGADFAEPTHLFLPADCLRSRAPEQVGRVLALAALATDLTVFVDAVDELPPSELGAIVGVLTRLQRWPTARVIWSCRTQVYEREKALAPLREQTRERITLNLWEAARIRAILAQHTGRPGDSFSSGLVDLLCTPFFLRIFASLWADEAGEPPDAPALLQTRTEAGLLHAYFQRRVERPSIGSRRPEGHWGLSSEQHAMRKRVALRHCAQQFLAGEARFEPGRNITEDDLRCLSNEGVLCESSLSLTPMYRFTHTLMACYAGARETLSSLSEADPTPELSGRLESLPAGAVRDGVARMSLLLMSESVDDSLFEPCDVPRLLAFSHQRESASSQARDVYLTLLGAYAVQGPTLPCRSLEQWPVDLPRDPSLVSDLVGVIRELPDAEARAWWESARDWVAGREIRSIAVVAALTELA